MIVYAASDLHGHLPDVPGDAELLLLAGDICPDFVSSHQKGNVGMDKGGQRQSDWLNNQFREWRNEHRVPIVATWGNHDFVGEHRTLWPSALWDLLVDEGTRAHGINIYGTPWVPGLPYWAFYGDERKLRLRANAIPNGLDVLMTHGPPLGAGDYIPTSEKQRNKYGNYGGANVGDPTLNHRIETMMPEWRPKVVICGHIHEDRGAHEVAGVPVHNVAAVDADYRLHSSPWTRLYELEEV